MNKTDEILSYVIGIKEDVAGIKEHLKTLNGKVAEQQRKIGSLEMDNVKNKIHWAKFAGMGAAAGAIAAFLINFLNIRIG